MRICPQRFWETINLPVMQNGSKQTDMGTAYPRIMTDRFKKYR
jgi:hypothetical protein